ANPLARTRNDMRRVLSLVFLLWGVATVMVGGFYLVIGINSPERFAYALVAGAVLLAIAWWFDRSARRHRQRTASGDELAPRESAAAEFKPSRRSRRPR